MEFRKLIKRDRAVSPVISTLLMVNVALAAGILYYTWAQSSLSKSYNVIQILYRGDIDRSKEGLVVEDARYLNSTSYPSTSYELNITVRNIGTIDSLITALYMNTTDVLQHSDYPPLEDGSYHILVGDRVTFRFVSSPIPITEGDVINLIVVTQRGTKSIAQWEVSP